MAVHAQERPARGVALMSRSAQVALLAGAIASCGGAALAQQDRASSSTIEEVVVTASRRAESTRDVASAITALTGDDLERINASQFEDFATHTPGLSYSTAGAGRNVVAIRGVTSGGRQASAGVGVYIDDVPIGSSSSFSGGSNAADYNVFDLDRIEVLSGPQGTLYGANALGGLIKYVTTPPDRDSFGGLGQAEVSETRYGRTNTALRAALNAPLLEGKASLRVTGVSVRDSGFIDNPNRGLENIGDTRTRGVRASFAAELAPGVDVRLTALTQEMKTDGSAVTTRDLVTHRPIQGPLDQQYGLDQPFRTELTLYSGTLNWNLDWATLASITAYQDSKTVSTVDNTAIYGFALGTPGPFSTSSNPRTRRFTQEIRLSSDETKKLNWIVGAFYSRERGNFFVDILDTSSPDGRWFGLPLLAGDLPSKFREFAVYGDVTAYLTDNLDVTLGVRFSRNRQTFTQEFLGLFNNPLDPFTVTVLPGKSSEDVATYLINPRYRISESTMVYARVASGYRPGGPNLILGGIGTPSFKSDSLWSYEIGQKSTLLGGKATLDASLYQIDWKDIQLTALVGNVNQLQNAGRARIQGAELKGDYRILPPLTVRGSLAVTDAKLTEPAPALGVFQSGVRLPMSPRFSAALSAEYGFELPGNMTGTAIVSYRHIGRRTSGYAGSLAQPLYELPSYNVVDAKLAIATPAGVGVSLFVDNLFDELGEVSAATTANSVNPAAPVPVSVTRPRTVGISLSAHF